MQRVYECKRSKCTSCRLPFCVDGEDYDEAIRIIAESKQERDIEMMRSQTTPYQRWYMENKERVSQYHREYYQRNKERIKERNKEYRETHREQIQQATKRWKLNNVEHIQNYDRNRYLQKKYAEGIA